VVNPYTRPFRALTEAHSTSTHNDAREKHEMNRTTQAGPKLVAGDLIEHNCYGHGGLVLNVETTNSRWPQLRVAFNNERHTWIVTPSPAIAVVHKGEGKQ
jgi:hypothetical protein